MTMQPDWNASARLALQVSANGDARLVYHAPGMKQGGLVVMMGPHSTVVEQPEIYTELERCLTGTWRMQALGMTVTRDTLSTAACWVANAVRAWVKNAPGWRMAPGVTMRTIAKMIEMKDART